jgi:putative transposase
MLNDPVVTGIITDVWYRLPDWFPTIALDEFVVMPNHLHLIVWLQSVGAPLAVAPGVVDDHGAGASPAPTTHATDVGARLALAPDALGRTSTPPWTIPIPETPNPNPTLGDVIGAFKSLVFTVYLDWVQIHDPARRAKFWQRNYYEHIIRNEKELHTIRRYIHDNPARWALDRDNPDNLRRLAPPAQVEDYLADIQAVEAGYKE